MSWFAELGFSTLEDRGGGEGAREEDVRLVADSQGPRSGRNSRKRRNVFSVSGKPETA